MNYPFKVYSDSRPQRTRTGDVIGCKRWPDIELNSHQSFPSLNLRSQRVVLEGKMVQCCKIQLVEMHSRPEVKLEYTAAATHWLQDTGLLKQESSCAFHFHSSCFKSRPVLLYTVYYSGLQCSFTSFYLFWLTLYICIAVLNVFSGYLFVLYFAVSCRGNTRIWWFCSLWTNLLLFA